ncbi:hypothetical protein AQUCO_08300018v1 [Aquilegia coerulea]|uniref:Uncharacterized protein n=1 Tax=Aquilegia coerulea TaxID=218851 RepID=A0A2G5C6X1_AQUCA|nr:hypothetical protein AQUCO_08300018v1 [Aquilegia coerulea]
MQMASLNSFCFILMIVMLLVSTELSLVQCRTLRPAGISTGCEQEDHQGNENSAGIASFLVSSNNSSSSTSRDSTVRSLAFNLASGPSKKGPGH